MQVASVIGYLSARYGGPPNVAINLNRELSKIGIMCSLWATASAEERTELSRLGSDAYLFDAGFPYSWFRSVQLRLGLAKSMNRIDILHLHQLWDYPIYVGARLAQRSGKPYLLSPHGIFTQAWRYTSPKKLIYLRAIALPLLKRAACIHGVSLGERAGLDRLGVKVPFSVIPNGVDIVSFGKLPSPALAEVRWPCLTDKKMALYLGRISPEKGLDRLVAGWKSVVRDFPSALLMIAGPDFGNHKAKLMRLITRAGLERRILMPGFLDQEAKKLALSRADIYIQPSLSEGFSTSVLEALCSKKPCVITTECNFPEVASAGAGEVVEPNSRSLAEALAKLLSMTPQMRNEIGSRGHELVKAGYTWDIAALRMLTVYRCILENKPIPLYPEPASCL